MIIDSDETKLLSAAIGKVLGGADICIWPMNCPDDGAIRHLLEHARSLPRERRLLVMAVLDIWNGSREISISDLVATLPRLPPRERRRLTSLIAIAGSGKEELQHWIDFTSDDKQVPAPVAARAN